MVNCESLVQKFCDRATVIKWLSEQVSPRRLQHILGVEQTSLELAKIHGLNELDQQKCAVAGLMHDLAKFFPPERLLAMAEQAGIPIDPICQTHPHLLHADISAVVAKKEFGITDPAILNAIANHTLGAGDMDQISMIVFIADAIEPNRGDNPQLQQIREISQKNLYEAVLLTCDYSLTYLIKNRKVIHPRTVATRNWALQKSNKSRTGK